MKSEDQYLVDFSTEDNSVFISNRSIKSQIYIKIKFDESDSSNDTPIEACVRSVDLEEVKIEDIHQNIFLCIRDELKNMLEHIEYTLKGRMVVNYPRLRRGLASSSRARLLHLRPDDIDRSVVYQHEIY